jgi:PGF-CTERM protein
VNVEKYLAGLAVLILLASAGFALAIPDAVAQETDENVRPSVLRLEETAVQAGPTTGESVVLSFDTRLEHDGGPAESVTVEVQAVDGETGMVETTRRTSVGAIEGEREVTARTNLTVAREGSYRIVTRVYENGTRIATGNTRISGVESLEPDYADTTVSFHRFETGGADLPVISFSVGGVENNRTTLDTQTYLTNGGSNPAGDLQLVVMARQADSNIVADRATVSIGQIGPGETVTPSATLTVPDDYNYHLDAVLLKEDVIVATATAPAVLDPALPTPSNQTQEDSGLETGEFARESTPTANEEFEENRDPRETSMSQGPGFGVAASLAALLALAVVAQRRQQ